MDRSDRSGSLTHHGVKGMKWGRRKADSSSGSSNHDSADTKTLDSHRDRIKAGGTRALQTQELQQLVNRMNLEQQYSKLHGEQRNVVRRGHKVLKDSLAVGKSVKEAYDFANTVAKLVL